MMDTRLDTPANAPQRDPRAETPGLGQDSCKLRLSGLNKTYGKSQVVSDVSLEVGSNELITLLGPSGSGKTTTMMMIAGFVEPDSGDVELDGSSLLGVPPHRRNIGVVFQNYALFPHMSVLANVAFPLRQRGVSRSAAKAKAVELLELVGLAGMGSRRVPQLSGGQQQRVALARALVFDPPLLIMDEPLSALDKRLREQMQEEIKRIQQAVGVTVLVVTHDQTEAFVLSDRIAVMNEGRILQVGAPRDVYERPVDNFVAEFLGESNLLHGRVHAEKAGTKTFETDQGLRLNVMDATPDSATTLLIRPERVEMLRTNMPDTVRERVTHLHGWVESVSFVGSSMVYRVNCDGVPFTVREGTTSNPAPAQGDKVVLAIPPTSCAALAH